MSSALPAIIRDIPAWESKTAAECREYLGVTTTVLRTNLQNANDLMLLLGVQVASGLASALSQAGLSLVVASLASSNGIDFGHQTTQDMLDALGENQAFAPYVAALKSLGQDTRTRWARLSEEDLPDADAFDEAYAAAELFTRKQAATASLREWVAAAEAQINAGVPWSEIDGKTTEELQ